MCAQAIPARTCSKLASLHPHCIELRHLLTEARSATALTQSDLAYRLQRPQSFVSKYGCGERRLDVIEFIQVCGALGASAPDMLDRLAMERSDLSHLNGRR